MGTAKTRYIYNGWQCIEEYTNTGSGGAFVLNADYLYGNGIDEVLQTRRDVGEHGDNALVNSAALQITVSQQYPTGSLVGHDILLRDSDTGETPFRIVANTYDAGTGTTITLSASPGDFTSGATSYRILRLCYYTTNVQGNVVAMTDGNGTVAEKVAYDIYGRMTSVNEWNGTGYTPVSDANSNGFIDASEYYNGSLTKNPRLFQGRDLDKETGLYYFKNRYYDPENGRFITRDPAEDGLNLYAFVNNNPINFMDPQGLSSLPLVYGPTSPAQDSDSEQGLRVAQALIDSCGNGTLSSELDKVDELLNSGSTGPFTRYSILFTCGKLLEYAQAQMDLACALMENSLLREQTALLYSEACIDAAKKAEADFTKYKDDYYREMQEGEDVFNEHLQNAGIDTGVGAGGALGGRYYDKKTSDAARKIFERKYEVPNRSSDVREFEKGARNGKKVGNYALVALLLLADREVYIGYTEAMKHFDKAGEAADKCIQAGNDHNTYADLAAQFTEIAMYQQRAFIEAQARFAEYHNLFERLHRTCEKASRGSDKVKQLLN